MNNSTYNQRRQVIEIIYDLKKSINLPRIDVRITNQHERILGVARMEDNIIWITENALNESKNYLRHVVAHEIGHAVFGLKHDESCPLMKHTLSTESIATKQQIITALRNA